MLIPKKDETIYVLQNERNELQETEKDYTKINVHGNEKRKIPKQKKKQKHNNGNKKNERFKVNFL